MERIGLDKEFNEVILKESRERIKRVLLFEPLMELDRKTFKDLNEKSVDLRSFGLFVLLYFFEMKLMREKRVGVIEIAQFLKKVNKDNYALSESQFEEIVKIIISVFRPTGGQRKSYSFYNFELQMEDSIDFLYIKTNDFDIQTNRQYYALDDDGLELVFATKEYFQEFQLSIHQLMLRKLLEKGEFAGALRQINEMRMDVETIHERMYKIEHEIKRNVVSIETQNRFMKVIEDRNFRLNRENEEFEELHQFVSETKQNYYHLSDENKEARAYEMLIRVEKALYQVHQQHQQLLNHSLQLKTQVLQSAEEALYYIGVSSFNFDNEITSKIVSTPYPLESMKGIMSPFLPLALFNTWSLLSIFSPQSWSEAEEGHTSKNFEKVSNEEEQEQYAKIIRNYYKEIVEDMMTAFENRSEWTLKEWIEQLQSSNDRRLDQRQFYDFFILCHQKSPITTQNEAQVEETLHLLAEVMELLKGKTLLCKELPERILGSERFEIQNMHFRLVKESEPIEI